MEYESCIRKPCSGDGLIVDSGATPSDRIVRWATEPGAEDLAALFGRFGYGSASEQGCHIGNADPNLETGSILWGTLTLLKPLLARDSSFA